MATILCRIVWAEDYQSETEKFYAGNMRYPAKHKVAHELRNFLSVDASAFGFVENSKRSINLQNINAALDAEAVDGVTVIWCALDEYSARLRVVGWYDNATAYRTAQPLTLSNGEKRVYQFKTLFKDTHLLRSRDRSLEVPMRVRRTDRGYIGQTNWFFPEGSDHYAEFLEAFAFMKSGVEVDVANVETSQKIYEEGQRQVAEINYSLRNGKLASDAKNFYGFRCEVCKVDFEKRYGILGRRAIEVHHLDPFKLSHQRREATLADVRVLCSNCHRMIHDVSPPHLPEELRRLLRVR